MAIYIDSAVVEDVQAAREFGWITGITTNPALLAAAPAPVEETLSNLAGLGMRPLFYQLRQPTLELMLEEAEAASAIVGEGLVLKVPPSAIGFRFTAERMTKRPICITAVFSPAQVAVAAAAGATYIAIYVNRATRLIGDGLHLLRQAVSIAAGSQTEVLAASLKSPAEVTDALIAGAMHVTAPLPVLTAMMENKQSAKAMEQFDADGVGLSIG